MLFTACISNNSHKKLRPNLLTSIRFVDIMNIVFTRRDVRAVDGTGLENRRRFTASVGSNPTLSSILIL